MVRGKTAFCFVPPREEAKVEFETDLAERNVFSVPQDMQNGELPKFQLVSMVSHGGTNKGGHYVALIKTDKGWYELNDGLKAKKIEKSIKARSSLACFQSIEYGLYDTPTDENDFKQIHVKYSYKDSEGKPRQATATNSCFAAAGTLGTILSSCSFC